MRWSCLLREIALKNKIDVEVLGEIFFPKYDEYSTGLVASCLAKIFNKKPSEKVSKAIEYFNSYKQLVPSRFPTFCAGCPERATLYAILKATNRLEKTIVCGDIGCYVISLFPPQECNDLVICMSGGISSAIGMSAKTDQNIIVLIGDSTFLHTGMSPLAEAINYNSNLLLIVLENSWVAMTGHQPVLGLTNKKLSIEQICRALGVQWLKVEDSYDPKKLMRIIQEGLNEKGLKVLIIKRECALQAHRWRMDQIKALTAQGNKVKQNSYQIHGCQMCFECARVLSCPAIRRRFRIHAN